MPTTADLLLAEEQQPSNAGCISGGGIENTSNTVIPLQLQERQRNHQQENPDVRSWMLQNQISVLVEQVKVTKEMFENDITKLKNQLGTQDKKQLAILEQTVAAWKNRHDEVDSKVDKILNELITNKSEIQVTKKIRNLALEASRTTREILESQVSALEKTVLTQAVEIEQLKSVQEQMKSDVETKTNEMQVHLDSCKKQFDDQGTVIQFIKDKFEESQLQHQQEVTELKERIESRDEQFDQIVLEQKQQALDYMEAREEYKKAKEALKNVKDENKKVQEDLVSLQNTWNATAEQYTADIEGKMSALMTHLNDLNQQKEWFENEKLLRMTSNDKMGKVVVDLVTQFEQIHEEVMHYVDDMMMTNDTVRSEQTERQKCQQVFRKELNDMFLRMNRIEMLVDNYEDDVRIIKNDFREHKQFSLMLPSPTSRGVTRWGLKSFSEHGVDPVLEVLNTPRTNDPLDGTEHRRNIHGGIEGVVEEDGDAATSGVAVPSISESSTHSNKVIQKTNNSITMVSPDTSMPAVLTVKEPTENNHERWTDRNNDTVVKIKENQYNAINGTGYFKSDDIKVLGSENSKLERLTRMVQLKSNSDTINALHKKGCTLDVEELMTNVIQMRLCALENIKVRIKEEAELISITKSDLAERAAQDDDYYSGGGDGYDNGSFDSSFEDSNGIPNKIKEWRTLFDENHKEVALLVDELKSTQDEFVQHQLTNQEYDLDSHYHQCEIEQQLQLWMARAETLENNLQNQVDEITQCKNQLLNSKANCNDIRQADVHNIMTRKTELDLLLEQTRTQASKIDRVLLELTDWNTLQEDPAVYKTFDAVKREIDGVDAQIRKMMQELVVMKERRASVYSNEEKRIDKQLAQLEVVEDQVNIQTYEITQVFTEHSKMVSEICKSSNINNADTAGMQRKQRLLKIEGNTSSETFACSSNKDSYDDLEAKHGYYRQSDKFDPSAEQLKQTKELALMIQQERSVDDQQYCYNDTSFFERIDSAESRMAPASSIEEGFERRES